MKPMAMELENLTLCYNGNAVLENVSATFPRNGVTVLVGPSGSGKSTLLRTLCRMNDHITGFQVQGRCRVLGRDIHQKDVDVYALRRQVGLVFQKPCVFPQSIYENTIFGLRFHGTVHRREFPERAEDALQRACLWEEVRDRLDHPAPTLSQGQQQRLALARTLALDPEILLMDEPTSALDAKSTGAIEDLVHSLKCRHTLVLVTHQKDQARRLGDRWLCMKNGTLRLASPDDL